MNDIIQIKDLLLRAHIGISDKERSDRQDVVINLALFLDTRTAGHTDNIDDAPVNYRTVAKRVIALVEEGRFNLVEKLAADIAASCLTEQGIERVRVEVEKPGALRFARSVGITIERSRYDG